MKKILLSVMVAGLSLIGFSSAITLSCGTEEMQDCSYNLDFPENAVSISYVSRYGTTSKFQKYVVFYLKPGDVYGSLTSTGQSLDIQGYYGAELHFTNPVEGETTYIDLEYTYLDSGGGDDSGGGIETIVPGGVSGLSGVVNNLSSTVVEFIPFIVYIGIGVLSAIIGFVAIKWLINWIRRKTYGSFR